MAGRPTRSPSPTARSSSPSVSTISESGFQALSHLAIAAHADASLKDGIENLISKERKIAELGILLSLSNSRVGSGSSILNNSSRAPSSAYATAMRSVATEFEPWREPSRIPASAFISPSTHLPSGMLRPSSGRAELGIEEAGLLAGFLPGAKCGLDLSYMPLGDGEGGGPALEALGRAISSAAIISPASRAPTPASTGATSKAATGAPAAALSNLSNPAPLRALDLRGCGLGTEGAGATLGLIGQFSRGLSAVSLEGNVFGGGMGVGAVMEALARSGNMCHLGITVNDSPASQLPHGITTPEPPWPPTEIKNTHALDKKKPAAAPSSKKPAGAASAHTAPALSADVKATSAYLAKVLKGNGTPPSMSPIVSLSLGQSTFTRASFGLFLSSWVPQAPTLAHSASHATAHAPTGKPAAAAKKVAPGDSKAKTGSPPTPIATPAAHPCLMALSLASTHVGSLVALDLSLALGPPLFLLPPSDHRVGLGHVDTSRVPEGILSSQADGGDKKAKPPGASSKTPAAKGASTSSGQPHVPLFNPHLHGSLCFLRVLNLSSCSLTSQGLVPVLRVLALECSFLSHLSLHGNAIDDRGAGDIASALLHNYARLTSPTSLPSDPLAETKGAFLAASKVTSSHTTPLLVLDLTGNPLSHSEDGVSRPGCAALFAAFQSHLPKLLTLTGPMPSPLGLVGMKAGCVSLSTTTSLWGGTSTPQSTGATTHSPSGDGSSSASSAANEVGGVIISTPTTMGWGDVYPVDLAAIQEAARAASLGGMASGAPPPLHSSTPSHRLALPGDLAHKTLVCTLDKVKRSGQNAEGSGGGVGQGGLEEEAFLLWTLARPALTASSTRSFTANSLALCVPPQPQPLVPIPAPWQLGVCCLELEITPRGQGGHLAADWVESKGWHLAQPCAFLEWKATVCAGTAETLAQCSPFLELTWGAVMSGSGGGWEGGIHLATLPSTQGSADRILARKRARDRASAGVGMPLPSSREGGRSDGPGMEGSAGIMPWASATSSSFVHSTQPYPLGQHDGGGASGAVLSALAAPPSAITLSAMTAAGAACGAYPTQWYSVALPSWFVSSPGAASTTLRVYGSLAQKTTKGVSSICASSAGERMPLNFAVLEAQVVMTGALPKEPSRHPHPYLKASTPSIYF